VDLIASRTLDSASISTLALLAAMPGPPQRVRQHVMETDAPYEFVPGDATTVDGWTSIAPTGGTAGRWLIRADRFRVPPLGAGADDSPRMSAAFVAAASKCMIIFNGAYTIDTSFYDNGLLGGIPSHTHMWCAPGTKFTATLPVGGTWTSAVAFLARHTFGGVGTTTLAAASVIGASSISAVGSIAVGTWIFVGDPNVSATGVYQVRAVAGVGPFTLTLDRPLVLAQLIGAPVTALLNIPQDVDLDFNGAILSGTGLQACAFLAARDSYIRGLRVDTSAGIFDQYNGPQFNDGCFNCHAIDCVSDSLGLGGVIQGPHMANSESCTFQRMRWSGPGLGVSLAGTIACRVEDLIALCTGVTGSCCYVGSLAAPANNSRNNSLVRVRTAGGDTGIGIDTGVRDTLLLDCICEDSALYGVNPAAGSIDTKIIGLTTRRCTSYGVRCSAPTSIQTWISDDNPNGHLLASLTGLVTVEDFSWGMDSTTQANFGAAGTSTGTVILRRGRSTVNASGGSATTYAAAACTFIREDVTTFGRGGHYSDAVNSMLIDREGVDDTACTVANVFGAGAQANHGTFVANGAAAVVIPYRKARVANMVVAFSMNAAAGAPLASPFVVVVVAGTSFSAQTVAADTSTWNWWDVSA
jgi:hypothetical protein